MTPAPCCFQECKFDRWHLSSASPNLPWHKKACSDAMACMLEAEQCSTRASARPWLFIGNCAFSNAVHRPRGPLAAQGSQGQTVRSTDSPQLAQHWHSRDDQPGWAKKQAWKVLHIWSKILPGRPLSHRQAKACHSVVSHRTWISASATE